MSSWSWWDELEQKLEQQLDAFLKSHPEQSERLRQEQLNEAAQLRRQLLELAAEIKQWQERTQKAQATGAQDLAQRAQQHLEQLMQQGRELWQQLEAIGKDLHQPAPRSEDLDSAWARFETEQALEELRRRQGL